MKPTVGGAQKRTKYSIKRLRNDTQPRKTPASYKAVKDDPPDDESQEFQEMT